MAENKNNYQNQHTKNSSHRPSCQNLTTIDRITARANHKSMRETSLKSIEVTHLLPENLLH